MKDREGDERKCEEEDKCGQKKDIEGARKSFTFLVGFSL
jgi:hypothetical protein